MKKGLLLFILLIGVSIFQNVFSQDVSIQTIYTEQKCDELVHRLTDSLMQITGDVSENYLKINEMTNRVTIQFITEFEKDLGKPVKGDDFKFLFQKSKECINEPTKAEKSSFFCSSCLGSGFSMCFYCKGRGSKACNSCHASGFIISNGKTIGCGSCRSTGYQNCQQCFGMGNLKCTVCNGTGHLK